MTSRFIGILFWFGVFAGSTFAGNDRGSGGGIVVCRDSSQQVKSIELLDLFENRFRSLDVEIGGKELSIYSKLEILLARIERFDPVRARRYRIKANDFFNNVTFTEKVIIPSTDDFGFVPLEPGCTIEQLAARRTKRVPEDRIYLVNKDLWDNSLLTDDSRAALILHEIVYYDATQLGQKNSILSRIYVGLMSSRHADYMDQAEYQRKVEELNLMDLDCANANFYPGLNSGVLNLNPLSWTKSNRVVFELTTEEPLIQDNVARAYLTFEFENQNDKTITLKVTRKIEEGSSQGSEEVLYLTYDKMKLGVAPVISDSSGVIVPVFKPKPNFSECVLLQNREDEVLGKPVWFSRLRGKVKNSGVTHEFSSTRTYDSGQLVKAFEIRHEKYSTSPTGEINLQTNTLRVISLK